MKKLDIGVIVTTLIIVTISCSLAFFAARVVGEPKDINLVAKNVAITFNDTSIIANGVVSPGWNTTKTFTITNNSKEEYKYNISIKDLVNTFVTEGYLQYKITSTNGYNMIEFKDIPKSSIATDTILAYSVSIPVGVTQSYTIEFKYANDESVDQSDDMGKKLSGTLFITEGSTPTLASKLLEDNPTISVRTDFSEPFTTNTANTLYKATENGIDVYYFAGVENIEEGCEYSGQKITDYSSNKLNENTCSGEIEVCHTDNNEYLYFGTSSCNGFDGSVEKIQVLWTSGVEKPLNNWVKFGKNSSNQDLYWRIIRTNSDGSIRLLYHGISTTATDAYIGESQFNKIFNDSMYVGYMYGTSGSQESNRTNANNSTIKTVIDNWYASNMTSYTKYLSTTAVYCNDRELASGASYSTTKSTFYYAAYTRLNTNKTPTYDCTNDNDKFTVDASTGNGKLTYPIALMTADEIAYAGGATSKKAPMWYYTNSSFESSTGLTEWWSLSPFNWNGSGASSWHVFGNGSLSGFGVDYSRSVRPVVSLKSCIKYSTGNGTSETPYEIVETSSGC